MKILCVGQNYPKHVAELGSRPSGRPIWFWKPDTCVVPNGGTIRIPTDVGAIHHEVELAVRIGPDGRPDAFTVAIDVTAREMQAVAKRAGKPWTQAKGYDTFLPLGDWVPVGAADLGALRLRLSVNGEPRQDGSTADMTWPVEALLSEARGWTTLEAGDILLTGTPHGVGPIEARDVVEAEIVGHVSGRWPVAARP